MVTPKSQSQSKHKKFCCWGYLKTLRMPQTFGNPAAGAIDPAQQKPEVRAKHWQPEPMYPGSDALWPAIIFIPQCANHWQTTRSFRNPHTALFWVVTYIFTLNAGERTRHES